jgi:hypothetical protein
VDADSFLPCCDERLLCCDERFGCGVAPNKNLKIARSKNGITNIIINNIDKNFAISVINYVAKIVQVEHNTKQTRLFLPLPFKKREENIRACHGSRVG